MSSQTLESSQESARLLPVNCGQAEMASVCRLADLRSQEASRYPVKRLRPKSLPSHQPYTDCDETLKTITNNILLCPSRIDVA